MTLTLEEQNQADNITENVLNKLPKVQNNNNNINDFDGIENGIDTEISYEDLTEIDNAVYQIYHPKEKNPLIETGEVNWKAINDMPEISEEIAELYGLKTNNEFFKKFYSGEEWSEWQNKGKIGTGEAWSRFNKWLMVPFVGSSQETSKSIIAAVTISKMQNGEAVTEENEQIARDYIRDMSELEARGGLSFGGAALTGACTSIGYALEFGSGLATVPEGGVGFGLLASTFGKIAAKKGAKKAIETAVKKGIKQRLKETAVKMPAVAGTSAKFAVTRMPHRIASSIADRQIASGIVITPEGQAIFSDREHPALSIMKAIGENTIEVASETSGFMFAPTIKYFAKPVRKALPENFIKNFEKAVSTKFGMSTAEALKKYGYDGVIEEMGEELLNRFLCQTFGINGLESYTIDGFLNNVLYADDPSQWGVEAVSFAAVGSLGHSAVKGASLLKRNNDKNKPKYTADNLYLDQGFVKIKGSESLARQELRKILEEKNLSADTVDGFFSTHSETEIRQTLKDLKISEIDAGQKETTEALEKEVTEVKDKVFNLLTEKGMDEEQADAISKFFENRARAVSAVRGISPGEWFNNLGMQFNNDAKTSEKNTDKDGTYNQSMIAGINPHQKIDVVDLTAQFSNDKNLSKNDLITHIKSLIGTNLKSKDKKAILNFVARSKRIGKKDVLVPEHIATSSKVEKTYKDERNTAVKNIVDLIQNSILIDVDTNKDKKTKPNVDNYLRFYVPVKINNDIYTVRITAENNIKKNLFNIIGADTYDVIIDKKMTAYSTSPAKQGNLGKPSSDNSITDNSGNLNTDTITIEDMLRGIKDPDGKTYFQSKETTPNTTYEEQKKIAIALYTINKEAKKIRDARENLKDFLYRESDLDENAISYLRKLFPEASFNERGAYIDLNGGLLYSKKEIENEISDVKQEIEEAELKLEDEETDEDEKEEASSDIEFYSDILNDLEKQYDKFQEVNLHSVLDKLSNLKDNLYNLKQKVIAKLQPETVGTHKFGDGSARNLYKIGDFTFHGEDISSELSQEEYDNLKDLVEISSENTLSDDEKISLDEATDILNSSVKTTGYEDIINSKIYKILPQNLKDVVDYIFTGNSVYDVTGEEFPDTGDKFSVLVDKVTKFYKENFNSKVKINNFGEVLLDKKSVKNTSHHNFNKNKINAFAAVPYVLQNGKIANYQENYEGKNEDRYLFVAPITVLTNGKKEDYFCEVVVKVTDRQNKSGLKRFYLHEVELKEKLADAFLTPFGRTSTSSKSIIADLINKLNPNVNNNEETFYQGGKENNVSKRPVTKNLKNVIDWTDKFDKVPTFTEIEENIKTIIESGEAFDTLSPEWKIDIKGGNRVVNKITNAANYKHLKNSNDKRHKKYVSGIIELINNAVYSNPDKNVKPNDKPLIKQYHYFNVNVKIGEKVYFVQLECEEYKKETPKGGYAKRSNDSSRGKSSVNRTDNNVKTVHLYNIKEVKSGSAEYFQGGKENENDIDFTELVFGKKEVNLENKEQFDEFVDGFGSDETRASVTFKNNAINEPKAVIELFENADKSSFLHEMAHLFLNDIITASKTNEGAKKELEKINEYLGHTTGEYTRKEHEKFAKGFELYLINGKAPNSKLKSTFDTFKTWLREIYNFVLSSNGALSKDVYEVYDSLFRDYTPEDSEIIRNIVLNAVNTAHNAKDGMKPLNDTQRRYKETAYDILAKALKKKKAWIKTVLESGSKKYQKQKEKIEEALANVSDEISSSDGMLPEWKEFFPSFGVGDNLETGTDYDLAQAAYRVIIDKTYLDYDANYDPNEIDGALIDKLDKAYKYILNLIENGNEKQKDYAVLAMYEWLEKYTPDERYQEIFSTIFEHDFKEIERLSNLDKFERAKEEINNFAKLLAGNNGQKEFNKLVMNVLGKLDFLTSNDKTKIFNNMMQYKTAEELRNNLDNIMDIAKILDSQNYFKNIENKIQKALAGTKNIKQGNKYVGRYSKEINDVFSDLRRYNSMTQERASYELENVNMFEGEDDGGLSFEDKLRRKFLYYKATPNMYISNDFISDLYSDIVTLKSWGYLGKEREKMLKKTDVNVKTEKLLKVLDGKKKAKIPLSKYIEWFANWESALNAIFNDAVKEEYSLLDKEAEVQMWQNKQKQEFLDAAYKIFGVNKYKFDNLIIDKLAEKFTFVEHGQKRNHNIELNKMNIIQIFIWQKNKVLKERLKRQFGGEDGLRFVISKLDNQEIEFANLLQKTAEKFYNEANRVFMRKYGIELPKVENYFPSQTERTSTVDLLADFSFQSVSSPSFIKNRVNSSLPSMRFDSANPLTTLFNHIDKMGVFIKMTDTVDIYNKVFTDTDVKKKIISLYGNNVYRAFGAMLANSSYNQKAQTYNSLNKVFDKIVDNFVTSNIILKPSITVKQLLSCVNYAENMPFGVWGTGFLKAITNPKETINFMMQDEYLKTRFETGGQNEYLQQTIENSRFAKTKKFIDFLSLNVKYGDIGAIIFGGKPYVDYLMKTKGMTKEAAFKEFRLATMRSQQASMASSLSNFQNARNPFSRALFSFRNTPNQYFRKVSDSIVSYSNGEITLKQCAKTIFIYTFLNAFMYNAATSLSLLALFGQGDDDDFKSDLIMSIFDFNSQAFPVIGDLYRYAVQRGLLGVKRKSDMSVPAFTDLFNAVETLTSEDVSFDDWVETVSSLADLSTGLPVQTAVSMGGGVVDIVTGKPASGALRVLGYSKKRAEKVTGEE